MTFFRIFCTILTLVLFGQPLTAAAEGRSIIVLDASGSMWGQIDGRTKLEIAREALTGVLAEMPVDSEVGLMAYGHRTKGDCADIELIVPPGAGTGPAISLAASNMQFLGKTPLTDSVRQAAIALRSTEEKATVILITDGVETCDADPCALGTELEASGVDFTAHVVGFGLTAEEGAQVACLAQNTGGQYLTAGDLASLTFALQTTVIAPAPPEPAQPPPAPKPVGLPVIKATPKPVVIVENNIAPLMSLSAGGAPMQEDVGQAWEIYPVKPDGTRGENLTTNYGMARFKVPPGNYVLVGRLGLVKAEQGVTLTSDATAQPVLTMNAALVTLRARGSEGGPVERDATFVFTLPDGTESTQYATTTGGEVRGYLPEGPVALKVTLGQASVTETLTLTAGQPLDRDVIVGSGVAVINGFYVEGLMVEGSAQFVQVKSAAKSITGERADFGSNFSQDATFTLPPGDYVAIFTLSDIPYEQPFSVQAGTRVEVPVILNAGVLGISSPGAGYIEVLPPAADANGNRSILTSTWAETFAPTLPAGDYAVAATRGESRVEAIVTVTAGARTEIALPIP